jgi:hypothetical protein
MASSGDIGPTTVASIDGSLQSKSGKKTVKEDFVRLELAVRYTPTMEAKIPGQSKRTFEESINNGVADLTKINDHFSDLVDLNLAKREADSIRGAVVHLSVFLDSLDQEAGNSLKVQSQIRSKQLAAAEGSSTITASDGCKREAARNRDGTCEAGDILVSDIELTVSGGSELPPRETSQTSNNQNIIGSSLDLHGGIIPKKDKRARLHIEPNTSAPSLFITDFFITAVREEDSEKYQIVETFGTNFLFFYGRRPRIYVVSGVLVNALNRQWKNDFKDNYDSILRGTELARTRRRAVFSYDDVVREGYLLSFSNQMSAENPHSVPFSFSFFVTKEYRAIGESNE